MTACEYINTLYEQIQNSYLGIPIDYSVLEEAITSDVITTALNPVVDNTYSTNCNLDILQNACNINIQIL